MSDNKTFVIPAVTGADARPAEEVLTGMCVLSFVGEALSGYNNELPFTEDAVYGLCSIIDGVKDSMMRAYEVLQQ